MKIPILPFSKLTSGTGYLILLPNDGAALLQVERFLGQCNIFAEFREGSKSSFEKV